MSGQTGNETGEATGVEAQWRSYLRKVIPDSAEVVQVVESRRAFYAGAAAMFAAINRASEPEDEERCVADIEKLNHELLAFEVAVREGRA